MGTVHFLNVGSGDCSIIRHRSDRITVIDICNGNMAEGSKISDAKYTAVSQRSNYHQKEHPVNPITYLKQMGTKSVWRFILTHPDMDHMDGLAELYSEFNVDNFWDTDNNKVIDSFDNGPYEKKDWLKYQEVRKHALKLYDGAKGRYYNCDSDNQAGVGDYLQVFCPTRELVEDANSSGDYNNASYIILYNESDKRILFSGDAAAKEWDVLLDNHEQDLTDIDVLIAPHHGRKSGGNDRFLDVLKPSLTLFGNADSKDLNYDAWNSRGLKHYTNNQGGTFVLVHENGGIGVYCTNERFAKDMNRGSYYSDVYDAWFIELI